MKVTFMGAGSTVFAKNVLGDIMLTPSISECEIALYDIDNERLNDSLFILESINKNQNGGKAKITTYCGVENRKAALKGANFVINAIQVGGYKPCTVTDFEIPKKYGLEQTIADTMGIGGIFRALRTAPVMLDFARDMEEVCPDALMLNYTNPMGMVTGALLKGSNVKAIGLCHSVQNCLRKLMHELDMKAEYEAGVRHKIAGINHMGWLLEVFSDDGRDLYPEIRKRAAQAINGERELHYLPTKSGEVYPDLVRMEILNTFGYYVTESSEHNAEYMPYFIKNLFPELKERYRIPIDEYIRRCEVQLTKWDRQKKEIMTTGLVHEKTTEYAASIIDAVTGGNVFQANGSVLNRNMITNLPDDACVEIPCLINKNGINPCFVGELPPQLAALNMTNINVQKLTIEAILTGKKEYIYYAALLDPRCASELTIDKTKAMCEELIEAHGNWLPEYN